MKKIIVSIIVISLLLVSVSSIGKSFAIEKYDDPQVNLPEYWALLISAAPDLPFNAEQVELYRDVLVSSGWKEENIIVLIHENATYSNIMDAIQTIADNDATCDTTLIHLAGHGSKNTFKTFSGWMSYSDLDAEIDKLDSAAVGIIISACFSNTAIPYLMQEERVIVTSCTDDCHAGLYGIIGYGLQEFADYCVDGGNNNGVVSLEEAFEYLRYELDFVHPFHPYIQDNLTGELHLTFPDWKNDHLDQASNHTCTGSWYEKIQIINSSGEQREYEAAQSFQPSVNLLTKVRLLIEKRYANSSILVSIRDNLTGIDLTSKVIFPEEVGMVYNSTTVRRYTTADFPDINVTPGDTYYIVCRTTTVEASDQYYKISSRYVDDYEKGMCYVRVNKPEWDYNWTALYDDDLLFITYGKNSSENLPPYVPKRPSGPVFGTPNTCYGYYASTEDVDGDQIYYMWDWGDGNISEWLGPYDSNETSNASYSWSENGFYYIKVKAKDEHGIESDWSSFLKIIIAKLPPYPPSIEGPIVGTAGKIYDYSFITVDPDGDDVYLYIDWGDGTFTDRIGPFTSGEEVNLSHEWGRRGNYEIRAKAEDVYGLESDWSEPFLITIYRVPVDNWKVKLCFDSFNTPPGDGCVWFGEKLDALDGLDEYDAPKNTTVEPPYLLVWSNTNFSNPWDELEEDYKHYPDDYKVWNLTIECVPDDGSTEQYVWVHWHQDWIDMCEYDSVILYDVENDIVIGDMLVDEDFHFWCPTFTLKNLQIICSGNITPSPPAIDGPTNGKAGIEYNYTFVSIDPNGDDIANYTIDWDDGSGFEVVEGPFALGEEVTVSHTWSEKGNYKIRAKAKDIYGAESDWGYLEVTMPRKKAFNFNLLEWLFERFPNAFPVIRYILEL